MERTLLVTDERCLEHNPGEFHPESPARLRAILSAIEGSPGQDTELRCPAPATREQLLTVHSPAHVDRLLALEGKSERLEADTVVSPGSIQAALLSAGGAIESVAAVSSGGARGAFSLTRPPGHHAEPDRAMGFCLFNNVAIAAAHAIEQLGHERILLIDWDVHHGNGTQSAFYHRDDVLFFSTHRLPFYPGTGALEERGEGSGLGYNVNVPLPPRLGDGDYAAIFDELLDPIADSYRPDLVLVSAGFDSHLDDPLGGMAVSPEGFAYLCKKVRSIAERHAGGKIALILEGGYDLDGLAQSVAACIDVLGGADAPSPAPASDRGREALEEAKRVHAASWPLL